MHFVMHEHKPPSTLNWLWKVLADQAKRSRAGVTTKIHAKSAASGEIIAFGLTGAQASDARHFEVLLDIGSDIKPRVAICDKGYARS